MIAALILFSFADIALLMLHLALPSSGLWIAFLHVVLTLAVLGPVAMLIMALPSAWIRLPFRSQRLTYQPLEIFNKPLVHKVTPIERLTRILDERVCYPDADNVSSLATMLHHGDLQARFQALETAVTSFEPRLSPLIAAALSDSDQTIRALAAAAATQVNYNLTAQRADLESKIALKNDLDDRFALAMMIADHGCHNELLSEAQRLRLCHESQKHFKEISLLLPQTDTRQRSMRTMNVHLHDMISKHSVKVPQKPSIRSVGMAS